ncbi:MAG: hypothetical protein OEY34_06680 [Cyclobacteriaceae bacterium]|nr:hypothetical protein [Cyclobacteriaceae bacterium]
MKTLLSLALIIFSTSFVFSQYRTGDRDLDASLVQIDAEAKLNFTSFKLELSKTYGVPITKVNNLSVNVGLSAGEMYFAFELSRITRKSIDIVIDIYKKHKSSGWGVIAKELGIKPGSPEFHALKNNAKGKASKGNKGNSGNGNNGNSGKGKKN